jgi:hypothetical protein
MRRKMRLVDDSDVEIVHYSHRVGRQIDLLRVGNDDRLNRTLAAEIRNRVCPASSIAQA